MGLDHPFDGLTVIPNASQSPKAFPQTQMSYSWYNGETVDANFVPSGYSDPDGNGTIGYAPQGYMVDDISALQWMYGVNEQTNKDDTVYNASNLGKMTGGGMIYETIWDAGGNDTLDWTGQTTACNINLNEGQYSFFGTVQSTSDPNLHGSSWSFTSGDGIVGIAYNCQIENAIGGSSEDFITGNALDNTLYGGVGANVFDSLTGGCTTIVTERVKPKAKEVEDGDT